MVETSAGRRVPKWEENPHTPGVFARVANKGDKSGQRTSMVVRPCRTAVSHREGMKGSASLHGGKDMENIAHLNEHVKWFTLNGQK